MPLVLYDTLRREKTPFEAGADGPVSMYVCGPTVQSDAHVGHGRYAVVFDVLRRWLTRSGHDVLYVSNITDVDDKIILRAQREGTTQAMVATAYTRAWNRTMDLLGVWPPDVQPFATAHIADMQALIQGLIDADMAYVSNGNVLFRVRSFDGYGKLSGRRVDDMQQGEDIVESDLKQDPLDFAMWKAAKVDEPSWPSPWGPGRPGWHIECSAMAARHLGHGFDIHGGGLDLVFPHHENEIAQHEGVHGAPFARYWVHNGMVRMGEEKMSKSLGNIIGLEEAARDWGSGPLRLWYLSAHHRSPLTFETDRLEDAAGSFARLTTFLRTAALVLPEDVEEDTDVADGHAESFARAMDDDLNAPQAVAALHELVSDGYEQLGTAESGDRGAQAAVAAMARTLTELGDGVLGLGLEPTVAAGQAASRRLAPLVDHLLEQRRDAREQRDFATADAIRDRLADVGVVIEDRAAGSRWYVETSLDGIARTHQPAR